MAEGPMPYDIQTERRSPRDQFQAGLNKLLAQALAEKSLTWFSAAGALGLWSFAVVHPDPWRLAAATGYSVICHLLPMFRSAR